jgi:hypothetical protein
MLAIPLLVPLGRNAVISGGVCGCGITWVRRCWIALRCSGVPGWITAAGSAGKWECKGTGNCASLIKALAAFTGLCVAFTSLAQFALPVAMTATSLFLFPLTLCLLLLLLPSLFFVALPILYKLLYSFRITS